MEHNSNTMALPRFSDYLIFIDESGDHGLKTIDKEYPVFVLCAEIIEKREYTRKLCPAIRELKMDFWGHDEVILHEREIRKPKGLFAILQDSNHRSAFIDGLNAILSNTTYVLIYSVIDKHAYVEKHAEPKNPYDLSMSFILERAFPHLHGLNQSASQTSVIVECRGAQEDRQLAMAVQRIVEGGNACGRPFPFDLSMVPKTSNSIGLQLADLTARPVGIRKLRPNQANRAYDIPKTKIRRNSRGMAEGWGVKVYP